MPVIRDSTKIPNTDQSWSKLQRTVKHDTPRRLRNTARSIAKLQELRRRYR